MPLPTAFAVAVPPTCTPAARRSQLSPRRKRPPTPSRRTTPSMSIAPDGNPNSVASESQFSITKTVMPADSDYSMSLWHGSYVRWLEEARVRYLHHVGLAYDDLVRDHATELVVRDLSLRYLAPAKLGDSLRVTIRLQRSPSRVRIPIASDFVRVRDGVVCASAAVTLVPVDTASARPRRKWPPPLVRALQGAARAAGPAL